MKNRSDLNVGSRRAVISDTAVLRALDRVVACEACSAAVSRPFRALLAEAAGQGWTVSHYVLSAIAACPACGKPVNEGTLVRADGERESGTMDVPIERSGGSWQENEYDSDETILITGEQLAEAQAFISGCIRCAPRADLPFIYILDELTESDPAANFVLPRPARCPRCDHPVSERTLVVGCGTVQ